MTLFQGQAVEITIEVLGEDGVNLPIGDDDLGLLANVTIGEAPRAIDGEYGSQPEIADDGTYAAAAVDVVRVELLDAPEVFEGVDLRVGHMEVEVENDGGPILCEAPMDKDVSPETVEAGDAFVVGPQIAEEAVLAAPALPVTGGGTSAALVGLGLAGAALLLLRGRRRPAEIA